MAIQVAKKQQEGEDIYKYRTQLSKLQPRKKKKLKKKNKVKKMKIQPSSQESSTNSRGVKDLEEEGSLLEKTFLKRNLHLMVTKFWEEKRDLMCFKCKRPGHIKYDCPLCKSEANRRMKKAMMATQSESEESSEEEKKKEVANCVSW